jgi:membrane protein implicated in regulation of membrane protease activity
MIVTTFVGLASLVIGLLIGWPVLVALSAIFVVVQVMMLSARTVVQRNDRRMAERLEDKRRRREG